MEKQSPKIVMRIPDQYEIAQELEGYLGDPYSANSLFSFESAVARDEKDQYPQEQVNKLYAWKLHHCYIPEKYGGKQVTLEQMFALWRVVARRDVSVMVSHMITWFCCLPVFFNGNEEQKKRLAKRIVTVDKELAYGLSERFHGSDLLGSETTAEKVEGGYRLTGEKWLINAAARSTGLLVFAKTPTDGIANWSIFYVEKDKLKSDEFENLGKIKTLGVRGAEIAGIRFANCFISDDCLIGQLGAGLEIAGRGLLLTRIFMPALCLGAADSAMRLTLDFAVNRKLYNKTITEIPHVKSSLCGAFADMMACDCVAISATRAIHSAPEQLVLWHSVVKWYVPITIEQATRDLSVVLGARFYVREEHHSGMFQKILRDGLVVALFDGSTSVVLSWMVQQMRIMVTKLAAVSPTSKDAELFEKIMTFDKTVDQMEPERISIAMQNRDIMTDSIETLMGKLRSISKVAGAAAMTADRLILILQATNELHKKNLADFKTALNSKIADFNKSADGFEFAKRHCYIHAVCASVSTWVFNRGKISDFFDNGEWVVLATKRLLEKLGRNFDVRVDYDAIEKNLFFLYENNYSFSVIPVLLASRENKGRRG